MVESTVKKIGGTYFVRVPPEEVSRLKLSDGAVVDLDVRPRGRSAKDVLGLKGRFRGQFRTDEDLWGDE